MRATWIAVELMGRRAGPVRRGVAGLTVLAIVGVLAGNLFKREAADLESALTKAHQERSDRAMREHALASAESPADRARASVSAFRTVLGRSSNLERDLQTIFEAARAQRLALPEGRYKVVDSRAGEFQTCEIDLPVKGSYRSIRRFAEAVLLELPHAALEDVRFKRQSVGTSELEAQLRFVLYMDNIERLVPAAESRVAAMERTR